MTSKNSNELQTIDKCTFRRHILRSFIVQLVFIIISYLTIRFFNFQDVRISTWIYLGVVVLVNFGMLLLIFDFRKYQLRFRGIYPDSNLRLYHFLFVGFFPVLFLGLTIFLCVGDHKAHIKKAPKFRYAFLALLPLLCAQVVSPTMAYLTASPSTYFIVDLLHDTARIIKMKDQVNSNTPILENYLKTGSKKPSSTEIVLLVALYAAVTIKDKNRAIASGENKLESGYKYGLKLMDVSSKMLRFSESQKEEFLDYSPLQWFHPSGPLEIALLVSIDKSITKKFHVVITDKCIDMLNGFEHKLNRLPAEQKEKYSKQVLEQRQKFYISETYKKKNTKK